MIELSESDFKKIGHKVDRQLSKVRQSLDEKGLIKLTKKLHRAVAEAREEKKGSLSPRFSEEARADRDRKDFLSQPESCIHIVKKAREKGWNGEKVVKKIVDIDRVYNDSIVEELSVDYRISAIVIREILNNESHFANAIEEYNILNRGW